MSERVHKTCPGCRKEVRVPVGWVDRAVKCKACGATIKGGVAKPIPIPATVPAATPVLAAEQIPVIIIPEVSLPPAEVFATEPVVVRSPYSRSRTLNRNASAVAVVLGLAAITGGILYAAGVFGKGNPTQPTESAGTGEGAGKNLPFANASTPYPRRLLFVSISRYAFLNPLTTGAGARGDAAGDAARKLAYEWHIPTDDKNNQFFLLSDTAGKDARPAVKSVVLPTIDLFFATSRTQDRVVVYFGGHAVEKEGKAYLVPSDGDPDDPTSLIPVEEFFAKMKACPAQQKLVIFDVCRFNPQFGRQRPGSEPMSDGLTKALHSPPPGVQVWTTCTAGENAVELPKTGSEFLAAFRIVADKGTLPNKASLHEDPIPVTAWAEAVKAKVAEIVTKDGKPAQTPRLTGAEPKEAVALNPEEPLARRFELPVLPKGADPRLVAAAFRELDLPGIRDDRATDALGLDIAFHFADGVMKDYAEADVTLAEMEKDKEKYAVRLAALDAFKTIRDTWTRTRGDRSGRLRETFAGEADDRTKKLIEDEQTVPARIELDLSKLLRRLEAAEKLLDKEPSKRWRATFQYAHAQALARWAYINEYDLLLGAIRKDDLPKLNKEKGDAGWQMVSVPTMKSKKDVQSKAEAAKELFAKVAAEHKGTPWALLAKQHVNIAIGLEWRAYNPSEGMVKDGP